MNTGAVQVSVDTPNTDTTTYTAFKSSFANTCPFTINALTGAAAAKGGFPNTTTKLTVGLYIGGPPSSYDEWWWHNNSCSFTTI